MATSSPRRACARLVAGRSGAPLVENSTISSDANFKKRWSQLSGGKPIVATRNLFENVSLAGLREIWNEFAHWKRHVEATLPEEERLFATKMNGLTVWVIEDGVAVTLMYPEDY